MKPTIYVQIAAYRDPELIPTIKDMLEKAAHPDRLRIGVMLQRCEDDGFDDLSEYKDDDRFKIHEIDYREAKGVGHARYMLNTMYSGERYMMQIDSHHRFARGWDDMCIDMMELIRSWGFDKPLISTYPQAYSPGQQEEEWGKIPCTLEFNDFDVYGRIGFRPEHIPGYETLEHPVPAKFIAAGFIFADGSFCTEVQYDPDVYFLGEEIDLTVRAFMNGYDLFSPHTNILWHYYERDGGVRHWDDHDKWGDLDRISALNVLRKFGAPGADPVVSRGVRSLYEYEKYAGVEFKTRSVHQKTIDHHFPPISDNFIDHMLGLVEIKTLGAK